MRQQVAPIPQGESGPLSAVHVSPKVARVTLAKQEVQTLSRLLGAHQQLPERDFCIDNQLVQIHLIIEMIRWTGLAPWEIEFPFPGSLISTFLAPPEVIYIEAFAKVNFPCSLKFQT